MTQHLATSLLAFVLAQAPAQAPEPSRATLDAVRTWIAAFGEKDLEKLRAASLLPFTLVTDQKRKRCDATTKDDKAFKSTLKCLSSKEKGLVNGFQHLDEVVLEGAEPKGTPPVTKQESSSRKLVGRLGNAQGQTTVEGYLNGDGETFDFVFAVRPEGAGVLVTGLALHSEGVE